MAMSLDSGVEDLVTCNRGLSRRSLLLASGGAVVAGMAFWSVSGAASSEVVEKRLISAPGQAPILGQSSPQTGVWCYDGQIPGPQIRLRQGGRVRVIAENRLPEHTTIHWHGVRVPNAMDGAPMVTQAPIQPGGNFTYEFAVPDAGTYWYHPHAHSAEQVGRGLSAAFIVEEPEPLSVDRDVVWVLGDWRLLPDASIANDFHNPMEISMSGRIGNTVTINGHVPGTFSVRSGERLRLRLINAAPARIFGLEFKEHRPIVIAYDGQPIEPHAPENGRVVLGPAMRADLILDMTGEPGSAVSVIDTFYQGLSFKLVDLRYATDRPLRGQPVQLPAKLPANTMPEPDIARAQRHDVILTGGMMSGMGMSGGMGGMMGGTGTSDGMGGMMGGSGMGGSMGGMMGNGAMWAINGIAAQGRNMKPILTLARGKTYILAIDNQTAWYHPIHLHGHSFRVITRNGKATQYREWRDTVLIPPRERAEIAFVADNPGDWMFHCHILDHQDAGMMSVIRVT